MNFLSDILSSRIRAEIFRLLFGTQHEELHMREIQRRSGCAIGTIQTELKKLHGLGLVFQRKEGNRLYYRANRDHILYRDIHSLVLKTNGLADTLRHALENKKEIESAFIIDRIGEREMNGNDIELLVIGQVRQHDLAEILPELTGMISREIHPHVMSRQEFISRKQKNEYFVSRFLEAPKTCIIGSEGALSLP